MTHLLGFYKYLIHLILLLLCECCGRKQRDQSSQESTLRACRITRVLEKKRINYISDGIGFLRNSSQGSIS